MAKAPLQQELQQYLQDHPETVNLELLITDMNGIVRGKRVGPEDFAKAFKNGVNFCGSTVVMDTLGRTFETVVYGGHDGDPDLKAMAVPGTLAPVPWASRPSGQVLLELLDLESRPMFFDPRNVLRRALQPLAEAGLRPVLATELEFYLVEHDGEAFRPRAARIPGTDLPQVGQQYAIMEDLYEIDDFLRGLEQACAAQNIPAGATLSEYSPAQFEINLHHVDDPVLACDHAVLLKRAVKAVARQHGLAATFMAKPFPDIAGSGLHVHLSLLDADGNNVFAGECADGPFSDTLRHAIGGLRDIMAESMAIYSPNANSYRRYAPWSYVPTTPNWGLNHRSLALRIPLSGPANTRVEHRVAGADANPYLVVATLLAGIHHGITREVDPGRMVQTGEVVEHEVTLPIRWPLALDAFDAGSLLPGYLGEDYHQLFSACRREEEGQFHAQITNRDFEWYLRAV